MHDTFSQSHVEQSTMQLIVDQIEELIVTIIEEVRQRPGVAVAILAAVVGALVGSSLAARASHRHASPTARVVRKVHGVGDAADLAALGLKLLQNPLVRGYVRSVVEGQLKKRFSV
jgi:uncharacterized membrane protein YeaQ/YmgE (transglycosylase-associated protein family)